MHKEQSPKKVRVSIGSAIVLELAEGRLDAAPTAIYMLTYRRGKCLANCAFCPQSKTSDGRADLLSRVVWPVFSTENVIPSIAHAFKQHKIKRVCIQALNYPSVQEDTASLARRIRSVSEVPISVSCQPLNREDMLKLAEAGVERVSIALDAATKGLFDKIKGTSIGGPYIWERHIEALKEAVEIFGRNRVTTHLIAGLGEKEQDLVGMMQRCVDLGVYPALFAFTPIRGTVLANRPQPPIRYYRKTQVAHYLITRGFRRSDGMKFRDGDLVDFGMSGVKLREVVQTGEAFKTSGCPGCNRPYYNERPGGPMYNFPRQPGAAEIVEIEKLLGL